MGIMGGCWYENWVGVMERNSRGYRVEWRKSRSLFLFSCFRGFRMRLFLGELVLLSPHKAFLMCDGLCLISVHVRSRHSFSRL